jgi:hypothetical protein
MRQFGIKDISWVPSRIRYPTYATDYNIDQEGDFGRRKFQVSVYNEKPVP